MCIRICIIMNSRIRICIKLENRIWVNISLPVRRGVKLDPDLHRSENWMRIQNSCWNSTYNITVSKQSAGNCLKFVTVIVLKKCSCF